MRLLAKSQDQTTDAGDCGHRLIIRRETQAISWGMGDGFTY